MISQSFKNFKTCKKILIISNNVDVKKIKIDNSCCYIFLSQSKYQEFKNIYSKVQIILFSFSNFKRGYLYKWKLNKKNFLTSNKLFNQNISHNLKKNLIFFIYYKFYKNTKIFFGFKKIFILKFSNLLSLIYLKKVLKKITKSEINLYITNEDKKIIDKYIYKGENRKNYIIQITSRIEFLKLRLQYLFLPIYYILGIKKISITKKIGGIGFKSYLGGILFSNEFLNFKIFEKYSKKNIFYIIDTLSEKNLIKPSNLDCNFTFSKVRGCYEVNILSIFYYLIFFVFNIILSPLILFQNSIFLREFLKLQSTILIWTNFINLFKVDHFLSYNEFSTDHLYRNIFLPNSKPN